MDTREKPRLDRRVQRTLKGLREALMALVVEKGYEAISIQDITDRANVSRTTFYLHFPDKDALLYASLADMYQALIDSVHKEESDQPTTADPWAPADSTDFEHVAQYADFYRAMVGPKGSAAFIGWVTDYMANVFRDEALKGLVPAGGEPRLPLEVVAQFMAGAQVALIRWWLTEAGDYSPQQMAQMMYDLSLRGGMWALGGGTDQASPASPCS